MSKMISTVLAATVGLILLAPSALGHGSGEWISLPDRQKGMKIVSAALADNGSRGGECKEWVRSVVSRATSGHVTIPPNAAEISGTWVNDTTGHVMNRGKGIASARPGDVVQMVIRTARGKDIGHTAIVASNDGKTIQWLESNWKGDGRVTTNRRQALVDFSNSVVDGQFSVFRIN